MGAIHRYMNDFQKNYLNLNFNINWNWNWIPAWLSSHFVIDQYHRYFDTNNNLKGSMSEQQYKDLLIHINSYMENVLIDKFKQSDSKLSKELLLLITNTVTENIHQHKYELTDVDIDRIANIIYGRLLLKEEKKRFKLSQENLEEISKVVKENIQLYGNDLNVNVNTLKTNEIDIDEIIFKILSSVKLKDFVDSRLSDNEIIISQQNLVGNLQEQIDLIRSQLIGKFDLNKNFESSLRALQIEQENLANHLKEYQNENNDKLEKLLQEINIKIKLENSKHFESMDKIIRNIIWDILGYKTSTGETLTDDEKNRWLQSVLLAKDHLENKLNEQNEKFNSQFKIEIDKSAGMIMSNISEQIKNEIVFHLRNSNTNENHQRPISLDEYYIKKIVQQALSVYDADKTGMVDFALESSGGQILSTRCTENYQTKTAQISIFGIPLWYQSNTPRTVISPTVQPGQCWAFQGFPGFLVLKLNHKIFVTGFTLEHIPKSLSPNGRIDSAPKTFTVWGMENESDEDQLLFGKYEYSDNSTSLQYFRVTNNDIKQTFDIVELRIESNHGNQNYTCLYRFRVHGTTET